MICKPHIAIVYGRWVVDTKSHPRSKLVEFTQATNMMYSIAHAWCNHKNQQEARCQH